MSIHIPKFCGYSLKRNGRNYRHFAGILNNLKRWRKQKSHSNKLSWISISFFPKPQTSLKFSSSIRCFIIFCGWVSKAFFTDINFRTIEQNLWMRNTCAQENVYFLVKQHEVDTSLHCKSARPSLSLPSFLERIRDKFPYCFQSLL